MQQLVDDLGVEKLEGPVAPVDHRHLGAQRGEHRGVFDTDDARADDGEGSRNSRQRADLIARKDRLTIHGCAWWRSRPRTDGDEDERGRDIANAQGRCHAQGVRIDEGGAAAQNIDTVAPKLMFLDLALAPYHLVDTEEQLLCRWARNDACEALSLEDVGHCRERGDRFAKRLAGNRARIHTYATNCGAALDNGDASAELGGLDRGALAGRTAAQTKKLVVVWHRPGDGVRLQTAGTGVRAGGQQAKTDSNGKSNNPRKSHDNGQGRQQQRQLPITPTACGYRPEEQVRFVTWRGQPLRRPRAVLTPRHGLVIRGARSVRTGCGPGIASACDGPGRR